MYCNQTLKDIGNEILNTLTRATFGFRPSVIKKPFHLNLSLIRSSLPTLIGGFSPQHPRWVLRTSEAQNEDGGNRTFSVEIGAGLSNYGHKDIR